VRESKKIKNPIAEFLLKYMSLVQLARETTHYEGDSDWMAFEKLMTREDKKI
jgi:hypothetical protein